jgi:hypothetical protein
VVPAVIVGKRDAEEVKNTTIVEMEKPVEKIVAEPTVNVAKPKREVVVPKTVHVGKRESETMKTTEKKQVEVIKPKRAIVEGKNTTIVTKPKRTIVEMEKMNTTVVTKPKRAVFVARRPVRPFGPAVIAPFRRPLRPAVAVIGKRDIEANAPESVNETKVDEEMVKEISKPMNETKEDVKRAIFVEKMAVVPVVPIVKVVSPVVAVPVIAPIVRVHPMDKVVVEKHEVKEKIMG